jgi:thiol-disulfide isomerase/thioredoxin
MSEPGFSQSSAAEQQRLSPQPVARALWPWLLLLAGVLLVVALRFALRPDASTGRDGQDADAVGTRIAALALEPLTGDPPPVSLADLQGKVTFINFWGTWCGPCAVEFPHLVELEQHFRSEPDFQFLSVSSNSDPRDDLGLAKSTAEFLKQQQAKFPTYRDPDAKTIISLVESAKLSGFGFPTTIVVDREGIIRGIWVGYRPGDEKGMRQTVERVLLGDTKAFEPLPAQAGSGESEGR